MNWDDLRKVWDQQILPEWTAPDLAQLEREFSTKQRKMTRMLFWRDIREAALGIFVAAIIARTGWKMGAQGWPVAFAVIMLLGLSAFFIRERVRARRAQPAYDAPLLVRLDAEIAEQRRQHHLLSHVVGWYLGPILSAGAIFGATILVRAPLPVMPRVAAGAMMIVILAVSGGATVWLNRRVVKRVVEPQLRELEAWRQNLITSE
jgi:hypothetical protein